VYGGLSERVTLFGSMQREPQAILQDAIAAAEDIVSMLGEMTEEQFVEDRRTLRAAR
jgi:uncharacterized protein with HEPN domain